MSASAYETQLPRSSCSKGLSNRGGLQVGAAKDALKSSASISLSSLEGPELMAYAAGLVTEYLSAPWAERLCQRSKVDLSKPKVAAEQVRVPSMMMMMMMMMMRMHPSLHHHHRPLPLRPPAPPPPPPPLNPQNCTAP